MLPWKNFDPPGGCFRLPSSPQRRSGFIFSPHHLNLSFQFSSRKRCATSLRVGNLRLARYYRRWNNVDDSDARKESKVQHHHHHHHCQSVSDCKRRHDSIRIIPLRPNADGLYLQFEIVNQFFSFSVFRIFELMSPVSECNEIF